MMWSQYKYTTIPLTIEALPSNGKSGSPDTWPMRIFHQGVTCLCYLFTVITLPVSIWFCVKIVPDYERMVIFRLGRVQQPRGPGLVLVVPLIDQYQKVDMRTRAFIIQPSKVKSRDDMLVSLRANIHFRVCDPILSVMSVQDLDFVIQHTAENLLAQSLGRKNLREIYGDRVRIAEHLKEDINEQVKVYGVCIDYTELQLEAVLRPSEDHVKIPIPKPSLSSPKEWKKALVQLESLARQTETAKSPPTPVPSLTLQQMSSKLEEVLSASLVSEVGFSYQLHIILDSGKNVPFYIDLTSGSGSYGWGDFPGTPDVTLKMTEGDLAHLIKGDLSPMSAFTTGRLHVTGDLKSALHLEKVLKRIAER